MRPLDAPFPTDSPPGIRGVHRNEKFLKKIRTGYRYALLNVPFDDWTQNPHALDLLLLGMGSIIIDLSPKGSHPGLRKAAVSSEVLETLG